MLLGETGGWAANAPGPVDSSYTTLSIPTIGSPATAVFGFASSSIPPTPPDWSSRVTSMGTQSTTGLTGEASIMDDPAGQNPNQDLNF